MRRTEVTVTCDACGAIQPALQEPTTHKAWLSNQARWMAVKATMVGTDGYGEPDQAGVQYDLCPRCYEIFRTKWDQLHLTNWKREPVA